MTDFVLCFYRTVKPERIAPRLSADPDEILNGVAALTPELPRYLQRDTALPKTIAFENQKQSLTPRSLPRPLWISYLLP